MLCSENANLVGGGSYILCLDALSVVQHTNPLRPHQGSPFSQPTSKSWISISLWPEQDVTMALSNICSAGKWCDWCEMGTLLLCMDSNLICMYAMHFSQHLTCKFDVMHYLWNIIKRTHMDRIYECGRATTQMWSVKKMQMHHAWNLFSAGCDLSNAFYNGTNNGNCYDETATARLGPFLRYKGGH